MAEFELEKIKIGNDVYKIAAGGDGPTVRTMHWVPKPSASTGAQACLTADEVWDTPKVGDLVFIKAMPTEDQAQGDWIESNYLMNFAGTLAVSIKGVSEFATILMTFNDEVNQAWATSSYNPSTYYNLISTRHDIVCVITGYKIDSEHRFTLRPLSKYESSPFGLGKKLYAATTAYNNTSEIQDSIINACGLLNGTFWGEASNNHPGISCKNASNQTVRPGGGFNKYSLGNGYYLEAFYFGSIAEAQSVTHFAAEDSTDASLSANVIGFYGCKEISSVKHINLYDTYFEQSSSKPAAKGYYPTNPNALSDSTVLCIYVVYRH